MIVSFEEMRSKNLFYVLCGVTSFGIIAWIYLKQDYFGDNFPILYWITFAAVPLLPVITLLQTARYYHRKNNPLANPFVFLAIGVFSSFIAEQIWSIYSFVLNEEPFPSIADVFYLGFYPFVAIFLLYFIKRLKGSISKKAVLFSLVSSCALLIPTITAAVEFNEEETGLAFWTALSYPIVDSAILVFLILAVITQFKTLRDNFLILLMFGLSIWIIADTGYLYEQISETYYEGGLTDLAYIATYLVWGISPLLIDKNNMQNLQQSNTIRFNAIRHFAVPFSLLSIYGVTIFMMNHFGLLWEQTGESLDTLNINLLFFGVSGVFTILIVMTYWNLNKLVKMREQEIIEKNQEIMRIEKLSTIGHLAASMAHDMRNPLAVIKNSMELLELRYGSKIDESTREEVSWANQAIDRISFNIENVLDYVRNTPLKLDEIFIENLIESATKSISNLEKIKIDIPKSQTHVKVDLDKMRTVFVNLLVNASQAIEGKGEIIVKVTDVRDTTQITIQDSGKGIPEELLPRIFEPLFTTKTRGTGLGLVSAKNIVEQHGGTISVKNNPTTFTVLLPKNIECRIENEKDQIIGASLVKF
jgi:signal transduction histidine kinase